MFPSPDPTQSTVPTLQSSGWEFSPMFYKGLQQSTNSKPLPDPPKGSNDFNTVVKANHDTVMKDLEEKEDEEEEEEDEDEEEDKEDKEEDEEDEGEDEDHEGDEDDVRGNPAALSSPLTLLGDTPPPPTKCPRPPGSLPTSTSSMPTKRGRTAADPIPIVSVPT
ncbi:uncharacterized protein EI90DRAFT_3130572 [Cantharellus anzutake]|uniref:uncharacterized protein n=1 Tax=Cantharellus anzutake TaxID=1750568 RepID=UPI001904391D|nr:uncharacterized protein EI90DRAFT_3130572 [Cantharellus anzutake]KAF8322946.1 hypothetical protein EI90DRAFT_3130572 [Cantharellus anzutake]